MRLQPERLERQVWQELLLAPLELQERRQVLLRVLLEWLGLRVLLERLGLQVLLERLGQRLEQRLEQRQELLLSLFYYHLWLHQAF